MSELETDQGFAEFDGPELEAEEQEQPEAEEQGQEQPEPEQEETPEEGESESASDEEVNTSERFVKRINKKHREMMEAKERADALEKRLAELEAKRNSDIPPDIPEVNPYADDYEDQLRERDQALAARAKWEARQEIAKEAERKALDDKEKAEQAKFEQSVSKFIEGGKKYNLSEAVLSESAGALSAMGFPQGLGRYLLEDDDGSAIIAHLAANPEIAEQVSSKGEIGGVALIERTVRQQAIKAFTQKQQKIAPAPAPDEPVESSVGVPDNPLLAGMTFE